MKRQFVDFLTLIRSGKALDGNGKKISKSKLKSVYNLLMNPSGNDSHSEWINTNFEKASGNDQCVNMVSDDYVRGGHIEINHSISLYPGMGTNKDIYSQRLIDINDWIDRADWLGFPPENAKEAQFPGSCLVYQAPKAGEQYRFLSRNGLSYLRTFKDDFYAKRWSDGRFTPSLTRAHIRSVYYAIDFQNSGELK